MKTYYKPIFFILLCLLIAPSLVAQLPKPKIFPQRSYQESRPYIVLQPYAGARQYRTNTTNINFTYVPTDPPNLTIELDSAQALFANKNIGGSNWAFHFGFSMEAGFTRGPFIELNSSFIMGKPFSNTFEAGFGWNFETIYYENERILTFRPVIDVVWFQVRSRLATFESNRPLVIGSRVFKEDIPVKLLIKENAISLKPHLSISTPISRRWLARLDAGYMFRLSKKAKVKFYQGRVTSEPLVRSPDDQEFSLVKDQPDPETPPSIFFDPDLGFKLNGERTDQTDFRYSGLVFELGAGFKFLDKRTQGRRFKYRKR